MSAVNPEYVALGEVGDISCPDCDGRDLQQLVLLDSGLSGSLLDMI